MADLIDRSAGKEILERLTPREREIVLLLLAGNEPKDIAAKLRMTQQRVYVLKSCAMKKLKINTEIRLVLFGIRMGLVDLED